MALAEAHGHEDIAKIFACPPPKDRLELRMPRIFSQNSVGVTVRDLLFEPLPTECWLVYAPITEDYSHAVDDSGGDIIRVKFHDDNVPDWYKGRELELQNLDENVNYKLFLSCTNEIGTTEGPSLVISTKAGTGRSAEVSQN